MGMVPYAHASLLLPLNMAACAREQRRRSILVWFGCDILADAGEKKKKKTATAAARVPTAAP